MNTNEQEQLLESFGWEMECCSPLEIRHPDGSFATGAAAIMVIQALREEAKNPILQSQMTREKAMDVLVATVQECDDTVDNLHSLEAEGKQTYAEWEVFYDYLFGQIAPRVRDALTALGTKLPSYCDPDSSYESDCLAYMEAVKSFVVVLKRVHCFEKED